MAYVDITYQRDPSTGAVVFDGSGYPIVLPNTSANTYGALQARVQNEVLGSPATSDIQNAIQDAILTFERTSFDFNRVRLAGTGNAEPLLSETGTNLLTEGGSIIYSEVNPVIQTVAGQEFYSDVDLPVLVNLPHITKIMVVAFSSRYPLYEVTPQWIDDNSVSTTWQGLPTNWAWDSGALRLYPVPDATYPLIIDATIRFAPLVNSSDFNAWTNRGEALIRYEAKRRLFTDITRDAEQAAVCEREIYGNPALGRFGVLAQLRRETMRRTGGTGKLRASRGYM